MFGSDTFAIYPYQLGHENDEGLDSGAWWFYYKLGFRPREPRIAPLVTASSRGWRPGPSIARRPPR